MYRLPDRNANREVRCNQCEKTLIVPKQSQTAPIVPISEQSEPIVEPKDVQPIVEPTVEPKTETPVKKEIEKPVIVVVSPAVETTTGTPSPVSHKVPDTVLSEPDVAPSESPLTADDPLPSGSTNRRFSTLSYGILALLLVMLVGFGGVVVGRLSVGATTRSIPNTDKLADATVPESPSGNATLPLTADDWKITEETLPLFAVRTADGSSATLTLDGDPTAAAKPEKQSTRAILDDITEDLGDSQSAKGTVPHTVSLRVDSESGEELCVVWPKSRNACLDEVDMKELKFLIYFSRTANETHKPGKPAELADFRLRIGDAFGSTEFVFTEKERISLCEKGRANWVAVSIPMSGDNDRWKREEHGRMTPKTVEFIEFRAKPTGNGVTFWVDNLSIGR